MHPWNTSSPRRRCATTIASTMWTDCPTGEWQSNLPGWQHKQVTIQSRPTAAMPLDACDQEFSIIQKNLPLTAQGLPQSDVDCLNLSLTVPTKKGVSRLPVFVFIHGGGFASGSHAWPQYDLARIVKQSADLDMPVIGIGIKYARSRT
jgi:carboxylesterase type B